MLDKILPALDSDSRISSGRLRAVLPVLVDGPAAGNEYRSVAALSRIFLDRKSDLLKLCSRFGAVVNKMCRCSAIDHELSGVADHGEMLRENYIQG